MTTSDVIGGRYSGGGATMSLAVTIILAKRRPTHAVDGVVSSPHGRSPMLDEGDRVTPCMFAEYGSGGWFENLWQYIPSEGLRALVRRDELRSPRVSFKEPGEHASTKGRNCRNAAAASCGADLSADRRALRL